MSDKDQCSRCRYVAKVTPKEGKEIYICRRYPPKPILVPKLPIDGNVTITVQELELHIVQSNVQEDDWCGEFVRGE